MLFKEAVSKRILGLMEEHNFKSRNGLAEAAAVPPTTLFDMIMCSVDNPSSYVIWQLCKTFKIEIKEFYDHELFDKKNIVD